MTTSADPTSKVRNALRELRSLGKISPSIERNPIWELVEGSLRGQGVYPQGLRFSEERSLRHEAKHELFALRRLLVQDKELWRLAEELLVQTFQRQALPRSFHSVQALNMLTSALVTTPGVSPITAFQQRIDIVLNDHPQLKVDLLRSWRKTLTQKQKVYQSCQKPNTVARQHFQNQRAILEHYAGLDEQQWVSLCKKRMGKAASVPNAPEAKTVLFKLEALSGGSKDFEKFMPVQKWRSFDQDLRVLHVVFQALSQGELGFKESNKRKVWWERLRSSPEVMNALAQEIVAAKVFHFPPNISFDRDFTAKEVIKWLAKNPTWLHEHATQALKKWNQKEVKYLSINQHKENVMKREAEKLDVAINKLLGIEPAMGIVPSKKYRAKR